MDWKTPRPDLIAAAGIASALSAAIVFASPDGDDPRIEAWAEEWPDYVEMYMTTKEMDNPTPFGGNYPYSKLIRYPGKQALWAGYAFAVDFNEDRGHYYTQIDQMETKRNDKEYLNAHGLPAFNGQPGACMNCHSGWSPILTEEMGWAEFNRTPYWDTIEKLRGEYGHGVEGAQLGSSCNDCHNPSDMSLRVNRQAFIDAMVMRGYEEDPASGLKGSPREMRDYVCAQCHVEYYFQGQDAILTYPWTEWPKDQPLRFEMVEEYYDTARESGVFAQDWTHAVTKAPMLKMQHPEFEVVSSGVHSSMIGCVDCHMPKTEWNGRQVTDHTMGSPLKKIENCLSCHNSMTADEMYQRVYDIQVDVIAAYLTAEKAVLALIEDVATVRETLAGLEPFSQIADAAEREGAISEELSLVLDYHRRASMRWDWIGASNSTGAHSPGEALRVLDQAVDMAQDGQALLVEVAARHGIELVPTINPTLPDAPTPIRGDDIVGSLPPAIAHAADRRVQDRLTRVAAAETTSNDAMPSVDGKQAFIDANCSQCHSVSSEDITATMMGLEIDGIGGRRDAANIEAYLRAGPPHPLAWTGSDADLSAVAEWLASK
ncbi:ammonia-forming cytochrome c nitrite reductase subunit c552 [Ruegeria arenilitoris]|uniref:ammonia-forming cytochrome c nitrite reductase subunit c552 n=1 Tax=Ruegeria arenilitoris TaxID=1173585 RepID=UPI001480D1D9|nr:ammonia-forming cytochrome c nitrite reductase subunit c552 [Ruegeria arenilitoris]